MLKREYSYKFEACSHDVIKGVQFGFRNLYSDDTADKHSLFIGQVIALFGNPEYKSEDNEDLFSQAVSATDKDGNVFYLEVYYGPSGPAITGFSDKKSDFGEDDYQKAIDELAQYIMDAEPSDFEWVSVYDDIPMTLKMGVKNGKPYYENVITDESLKELFEKKFEKN